MTCSFVLMILIVSNKTETLWRNIYYDSSLNSIYSLANNLTTRNSMLKYPYQSLKLTKLQLLKSTTSNERNAIVFCSSNLPAQWDLRSTSNRSETMCEL